MSAECAHGDDEFGIPKCANGDGFDAVDGTYCSACKDVVESEEAYRASLVFDGETQRTVLRALALDAAGEHVPNTVIDRAVSEIDRACSKGNHFRVVDGKCVWCTRKQEGRRDRTA